MII
ncbi:hypothetical protein YPPY94_1497, partial [Yersinia pestis PY-94]|jgi:acetyl-CoA acyltransferase 1